MRRIDRIRSMSVHELADMLIENGIDIHISFCPSAEECGDYEEKHGELPPGGCRECLIKWLMEEEN